MSLATCNAYLAKIDEVIALCGSTTTGRTIIETKFNELYALDSQFITETTAMTTPPYSMEHFVAYVNVMMKREMKRDIQASILEILHDREKFRLQNAANWTSYAEMKAYEDDTTNLQTYYDSVSDACECMKGTKKIITRTIGNGNGKP